MSETNVYGVIAAANVLRYHNVKPIKMTDGKEYFALWMHPDVFPLVHKWSWEWLTRNYKDNSPRRLKKHRKREERADKLYLKRHPEMFVDAHNS